MSFLLSSCSGRGCLQSTFVYGITCARTQCMLSLRTIMERIFLTCHRSNMSNPHSCGHKSTAAAWMKHKCGMSLQGWTCVSFVSGDVCSQKATIFVRQYQSHHFDASQPNALGWFGSKTQARFQCLLFKIDSYSRQRVQSNHVKEEEDTKENFSFLIKTF